MVQYVDACAYQVIKKYHGHSESKKADLCLLYEPSLADQIPSIISYYENLLVEVKTFPLNFLEQMQEWKDVCSYSLTGDYSPFQNFYWCKTCKMTDNQGCCEACVRNCHVGHEVEERKFTAAFCDCGPKGKRNEEMCIDFRT